MGVWSWFFPSPADRVAKARALLAAGRPADARLELLGVDHPGVPDLLLEAENGLVPLNLEVALRRTRAGDDRAALEHLELAERYHHGGHEEAFRAARREMREIRAERSAAEQRAKEERAAKLMAADPLGLQGGPSLLDPQLAEGVLDADREELAARIGLLVENYPEALRGGIEALGAPFARAVLDLEDGRADLALQALLALPDDAPLVCWERGRAAVALGDPRAAARSVKAFATHAGGHHHMGQLHSGALLAHLLAESGDLAGGLRVLRDVRATEPKVGAVLLAQLLEATGELAEAEQVLTALIRENPRQHMLYAMLARVRLRGGHRFEAMRALEASLANHQCVPGKCGYQAPNLDILRGLATLYLEDGIERERALELAAQAAALVDRPTQADLHLQALVARATGAPEPARLTAGGATRAGG